MVVAVCALLVASGRADFSENEIAREVEKLQAELRARYGFSDPERADGAELWAELLARVEEGTSESSLELWVRPLHSPGLAGGRLWLTGPADVLTWTARRWRGAFDKALAELRPDGEISVAFMAVDPREGGKP